MCLKSTSGRRSRTCGHTVRSRLSELGSPVVECPRVLGDGQGERDDGALRAIERRGLAPLAVDPLQHPPRARVAGEAGPGRPRLLGRRLLRRALEAVCRLVHRPALLCRRPSPSSAAFAARSGVQGHGTTATRVGRGHPLGSLGSLATLGRRRGVVSGCSRCAPVPEGPCRAGRAAPACGRPHAGDVCSRPVTADPARPLPRARAPRDARPARAVHRRRRRQRARLGRFGARRTHARDVGGGVGRPVARPAQASPCRTVRYPPNANRTASRAPTTSEYTAKGSNVFARK